MTAHNDFPRQGLKWQFLHQFIPMSLMLACAQSSWGSSIGEVIPENENASIQQIVQLITESVRADAKHGTALRGAHAKAHGCVQAEFSVLPNLPAAMKVGIFKDAQTFPAWIRFSNGSGKIQDDSVGDGRGMAIKLMGVERSDSGTQDFVMINHPVFFVRNANDYIAFQQALADDSLMQFFFPSFNPFNFRLHELGIANAIRNTDMTNPLDSQYWSMTPYRLGDAAIKFSARPCATTATNFEHNTPNFLRDNMQQVLSQSNACFDFQVQLRTQPLDMPIEDPTIEWSENDSPFISVAKITIAKQQFTSPEQLQFCENLSFTPWHSLQEHEPLGGINRVRKTVYDTIARLRHELNGVILHEPTGF